MKLFRYLLVGCAMVAAQPGWAQVGPGFGAGVVIDFGDQVRVKDAVLVNNIVRVTAEDNASIRPMVDVHAGLLKLGKLKAGPFLGVQLSKEQIVDSLGVGMMVNFPVDAGPAKWLNLGIGVVVDPNVKTLGNDILEDQPLPAGETEIRYRTKAKFGMLLMTSVGF